MPGCRFLIVVSVNRNGLVCPAPAYQVGGALGQHFLTTDGRRTSVSGPLVGSPFGRPARWSDVRRAGWSARAGPAGSAEAASITSGFSPETASFDDLEELSSHARLLRIR